MAYSQPWDEAFPPDTQAANLLGDDIRDFKTAIRERIQSFAAGPLGSRPVPEAVWAGVMYFSTDTHQVFRWNGASWDDITAQIGSSIRDFDNLTAVDVTSPGGAGVGISVAIPADAIQVGSVIEVFAAIHTGAGMLGAPTFRVRINGSLGASVTYGSLEEGIIKAICVITGVDSGTIVNENQRTGVVPVINTNGPGNAVPFAGFNCTVEYNNGFTGTATFRFIHVRIRK